ncbi:MAG: hypothetical protein IPM48_12735 [Saprospiraceae bacterium]|nr:hypothetical protein [Saprospiraceae bacterium]
MKRDDLIHPILSGNKLRKIVGFLEIFRNANKSEIITCGSLHSNFIHAFGYIASQLSLKTNIWLYGHNASDSFVTNDLEKWGIKYQVIDRKTFKLNFETYFPLEDQILYIKEGGQGVGAEKGVRQLIEELDIQFNSQNYQIVLATGTGTMLQCIQKIKPGASVVGFSPVSNNFILKESQPPAIYLQEERKLAFGGYSADLMKYIDLFYCLNSIWLDPIYTGRLVKALDLSIEKLDDNKVITILHTGGLQAWRSYLNRWPQAKNYLDYKALENFIATNFS